MPCPACCAENPATARFCMSCGAALVSASGQGALTGQRKHVTVLFADVVGSTELIGALDPEEAQALLDGAVRVMMGAVHRYGGTVTQTRGDSIVALFGAPVAHEDHAVRACHAALAMQEAFRREGTVARPGQLVPVQLRAGLNSGEVVVRSIANDVGPEYTAMGQAVHLAARIEQAARPGTVVVGPATRALADGYVQVRPLGHVQVKGLPEPVELCELLGTGPARSRLDVAAVRGLTRFVGRRDELATLHRALARAEDGTGRVVGLVGEPGVGKSRLVWEVTHSCSTRDWLVLECGSLSYGMATSYLPIVELLRRYARIEPRDDAQVIREKLTGRLLGLDPALRPTLPALLALLAMDAEEASWLALDPAERRRQMLEAVTQLLLRASREQPLLLVVEDLHWIDAETQALLDSLVAGLATARVLLVVTYRPEYRFGWGDAGCAVQLRIDPLPPASSDELLTALLGADPSLAPLKALLTERTAGNPFFLEESVRSLAETGLLGGERGAYRLVGARTDPRVPGTVLAVLAARIDRLPPAGKELLQLGAVIGKEVPVALLRALAGLDEEGLTARLAELQAAELVYELRSQPEPAYTFAHALTHEVAYDSLLRDRRRALHGEVLDAMARLYADGQAEHVERLAHHALCAERWEAAVGSCHQAAIKSASRSAFREATTWLQEALRALGHLPERRETQELALDIRMGLRNALFPLGESQSELAYLPEAEALAEALDDDHRLATVYVNAASQHQRMGDLQRSTEYGELALELANALGSLPLQFEANNVLGVTSYNRGEYQQAARCFAWAVEHLRLDPLHDPLSPVRYTAHGWLACSLSALGRFREVARHCTETARIAEAPGQPLSQTAAFNKLGLVCMDQGRWEQARTLVERGLALARSADLAFRVHLLSAQLGYVYIHCGRLAEGTALLEQAVGEFAAMGHLAFQSLRVGWLSEAYRLAGRGEDARRRAEQAVDLAVRHGELANHARALRMLAEAATCDRPHDVEEAERHFREAGALAEALGMRPLLALCRLGLGRLFRRAGWAEEAQPELSAAVALLREMEMAHWLPDVEATLATTGR